VLVSAGGGDNMMGAIGTGNTRPGVITASFGTSGTIYACSDKPVVDPKGEIAAFCDSTNRWLPLLCTMNVTVATEMVRRDFAMDLKTFDAAVAKARPGADGLVLLPYLEGERTPNVPNGTGVFIGVEKFAYDFSVDATSPEGIVVGQSPAAGLRRRSSRARGALARGSSQAATTGRAPFRRAPFSFDQQRGVTRP
jgi:sugar (pentulose or hexulose) kinase